MQQLDNLLNDELLEFLPQLVQVRISELPKDSKILTSNSQKEFQWINNRLHESDIAIWPAKEPNYNSYINMGNIDIL